jgi:hypothetical protein
MEKKLEKSQQIPFLITGGYNSFPTMLGPVERLYPPAFGAGRRHTRWVERGVGVNILEDARHSSVLYICKYFVLGPLSEFPKVRGS